MILIIANFGLSTMIPFFVAIKFLSLLIMAEALVISRNFLYLLFEINVIVPDCPLSIAETPLMISLGSPMSEPPKRWQFLKEWPK